MSFTGQYRTLDGLEAFEKDDIETLISTIETTAASFEKKMANKRSTKHEEHALHELSSKLVNLVLEWAQRPGPSSPISTRVPQLDNNSRRIIRDLYILADRLTSEDVGREEEQKQMHQDFHKKIENLVKDMQIDGVDEALPDDCQEENEDFYNEERTLELYQYGDIDWSGPEPGDDLENTDTDSSDVSDEDSTKELQWPGALVEKPQIIGSEENQSTGADTPAKEDSVDDARVIFHDRETLEDENNME